MITAIAGPLSTGVVSMVFTFSPVQEVSDLNCRTVGPTSTYNISNRFAE